MRTPEGNGNRPRKGGLEPSRADTVQHFQLAAGGNAALSSHSDGWPSHFVRWHLGRTKGPLFFKGNIGGMGFVGANGEATRKHNMQEYRSLPSNKLRESGLLYVPALADTQRFVPVWSLADTKSLVMA